METMGPTQDRIPMLNGIHLLQSQVYGNSKHWRHMDSMGPTQCRIPMLNGIHLLQSQIYGKPNVLDGL